MLRLLSTMIGLSLTAFLVSLIIFFLRTCTTMSWTFRIFYETALLEYERYKTQNGVLQLAIAPPPPDSSGVDNEGGGHQVSASGRAQRVSAARAVQGWHEREVGEPIVKDRGVNNMPKREKTLKNIGSLKHKRQNEVEHPMKAARIETSKQVVAPVVDVGPPAEWVKINVRETKDCFEVYALVPGLLREEEKKKFLELSEERIGSIKGGAD